MGFLNNNSNFDWLPISDLMSVLMLIFFVLSVIRPEFLIISDEESKIKEINSYSSKIHESVSKKMKRDFSKGKLKNWRAVFDERKLVFQFHHHTRGNTLFKQGQSVVSRRFKKILSNFCPRMVRSLEQIGALNKIHEIRIEGHASPEWSRFTSKNNAYRKNMRLSQERAYNVFDYCFSKLSKRHQSKLRKKFTIGSYSSQKAGKLRRKYNRIVKFKIVLKQIKSVRYAIKKQT